MSSSDAQTAIAQMNNATKERVELIAAAAQMAVADAKSQAQQILANIQAEAEQARRRSGSRDVTGLARATGGRLGRPRDSKGRSDRR